MLSLSTAGSDETVGKLRRPSRPPTYEELLEVVGHRRWYQLIFLCLTAIAVAFPSMQILSFNFTALPRQFTCNITAINSSDLAAANDSSCWMLNSAGHQVDCKSWNFKQDVMEETVIESFGLVCGWQSGVAVVKILFMLGFLFGSSCFGILSDRWGRRKTFMLACVCLSISGVVGSFTREIIGYGILRTLSGFSAAGVLTVSYTWHTEMLHSRDRFTLSLVMKNGWSIGIFILTAIAYGTRRWRFTELSMAAPALLLILYYFVLAESPRWLLSVGKVEEAANSLRRMAKVNGKLQQLEEALRQRPVSSGQVKCQLIPVCHLLRVQRCRTVALTVWSIFCITSIGYYGLSLAWSRVGGDIYITMSLGACVEIGARLFGIMCGCWLGRVRILGASLAVAALSLLLLAVLKEARVLVALAGRFGLLLGFELIWLYANEIFPTVVRNAAVGVGSTTARVGGVLAPQIGWLGQLWAPLPMLVYCVCSLLGACLAIFLLPETRNFVCPDSLEEAEVLCSNSLISRFFLYRRARANLEMVADEDENELQEVEESDELPSVRRLNSLSERPEDELRESST